MNYYKKAENWLKKLKEEEASDIEFLTVTDNGYMHINKDRIIQPDFVYCYVQKAEKEVIENSWSKEGVNTLMQAVRFVMKEQKKVICVLGEEEAYGFGFGEKQENQRMLLYMRIGSACVLLYSNDAGDTVYDLFGYSTVKPEGLDCLIRFLKTEKEGIADKNEEKESGCCE